MNYETQCEPIFPIDEIVQFPCDRLDVGISLLIKKRCKIVEKEDSMNISIIDEVVEQLKVMPQHLQWQVLEFVRTLVKPKVRGVPGRQLLQFAGSIPPDDLQLMREAIGQGCEQVDINEW